MANSMNMISFEEAYAIVRCYDDSYLDVAEELVAAYSSLDAALDQACTTFNCTFDTFAGGLPYTSANYDAGTWYEIRKCRVNLDLSYE